ncbi:hypothetical protein IWZ01DRAFT_293526 [Phyllosticta capitalensis]
MSRRGRPAHTSNPTDHPQDFHFDLSPREERRMPPFVSEALSTSFKCAEFAPPPHDAFFMDADDPVPSIEQTDNHDIFKPSSASLLLSRHGASSTTGSSRTSSPSRRHLVNISGDESRTSTPASDFSSSLISKYGGVHGPAAFHTTAAASPGSTMVANGGSREKKKYPGLLHANHHVQSNSGRSSPATHLESQNDQQSSQNDSESNSNMMAHETHSPTPTTRRHHKHRTHKKSSSNHNNSTDARDARPLILLHATILPVIPPAPASTMTAAKLPGHVLQNWRLLEQKLADPVLMSRGLLLPHPRDEYDLLEERLLEALELKTPRVWRCGHFYSAEESEATGEKRADSAMATDEERPVAHQHCATNSSSPDPNARESPSGSDNDEDDDGRAAAGGPVCTFCHEPLHVPPSLDTANGSDRWDIRIYAANGLMRSTAWSAAWSEMERVDVSITPLLTSAQRLALAAQVEREESEAENRERARERELHWAAAQRAMREKEEHDRQLREELERERARAQEMAEQQEAEKLRYMAAAAVAAASERKLAEEKAEELERQRARELEELESVKQRGEELSQKVHAGERMSLGTLIRNCVVVLATDRRNIAAVLLAVLVAFYVFLFTTTPVDFTPNFSPAQVSDVNFEPEAPLLPLGDGTAVNYSLPLALEAPHSTATVTSTVTLFLPATSVPSPSDLSVAEPQIHTSTVASETLAPSLEFAAESKPETPIIALDIQDDSEKLDHLDLNIDARTPHDDVALASTDLDPCPSPSSSPVLPVVLELPISSISQERHESVDEEGFDQCPAPTPRGVLVDLALPWCAPSEKHEDGEGDGEEYWELKLINDYVDADLVV